MAVLLSVLFFVEAPLAGPRDKWPGAREKGTGAYRKNEPDGYGGKRPIRERHEARKEFEKFFKEKNLKVGNIKEGELLFEAEILDRNNNVVDKVVIDKRTGRIRSIY